MIIRIATEGQYELAESDVEALNELDNEAVAACEAGDDARFHATFSKLLDLVRSSGRRVPDDELVGSDIWLPPPDVTLEEAQKEFRDEGLIPG